MTGVVLCGGQSSRMGVDKGMITYQSMTWTQLAINKFLALNLPVILSVNAQQYQEYFIKFHPIIILPDHLSLDVYGPLKGLLSVHLQYPSTNLFVVACDMPSMHMLVLEHLLSKALQGQEEAFVYNDDENTEPLCAVYTSKGLEKIYKLYRQEQLKKHSLHYMIENMQTCYLSIPPKWKKYFKNYNSPSDLEAM